MRWIRASRRRRLSAVAVVALTTVGLTTLVSAPSAAADSPQYIPGGEYAYKLLAKAQPDECFNGIGQPYPAGPPCEVGQPKVDQSYVWGLTQVGSKVWFGTGANVQCFVTGATLGDVKPSINDDYVCEYGESQIVKQNPGMPASVGDQRPPEVMYYDTDANKLVDETAEINAGTSDDQYRLKTTLGLRAGGSFNGVVLMAGPALGQAINLFAFDGETGAFLGSTSLTAYGNIRHFYVADGALYAGVGIGRNGDSGGAVLRWTGDKTNPFSFEDVGDLPAQAADLTFFEGHIFVSTWAHISPKSAGQYAGIWESPLLYDGDNSGLTTDDADDWKQVWNATMYEPDPVVAATYGMGGLAAFDGYLYFGTMHVPMKATTVFQSVHPAPQGTQAYKDNIANTQRAISVFRGRYFGTSKAKVDLLYGATQLPTFDTTANGGAGAWVQKSTNYTPLYGDSGFGNKFNNYEWIMTVAAGKLFVGTMDWSYLAKNLLPPGSTFIDPAGYGGDLYAFTSPNKPAEAVNTTGVGNYLNYGVRNMISKGNTLYLGMANPMNLRTSTTDGFPLGGWELTAMNVW
jgi:hypothetical protein